MVAGPPVMADAVVGVSAGMDPLLLPVAVIAGACVDMAVAAEPALT